MLPNLTSRFVNTSLLLPRTESSKPVIEKRDLLLSVPFYVYEDLAWNGATLSGKSVEEIADPSDSAKGKFKHGGDYWMWKASLNGHPMRTKNMSEAKLFFVPWLMNFWDYRVWKNRSLCVNGLCDIALLLDSLDKLVRSPAFQQYPDHHIIVRSFFSAASYKWNSEQIKRNKQFQRFLDAFKQMQVLVFEGTDRYPNKAAGRHSFTSYHVGSPCPIYSENDHGGKEKPFDVGMIGSLHKEKQAFKNRRKICKWLGQINDNNNNNKSNSTMIRISVCGEGSQCPALAESRFGFHAAGDTYSSQRLMDTILSGTVPIFTHLHQYELAGDWIDWSQLSYYLPVHDDTGAKNGKKKTGGPTHKVTIHSLRAAANCDIFEERLRPILKDEAGYQAKHEKILQHIPLFDYTTLYPFDTYMYLFQAELFPETRHPIGASWWSALRLPPPLFVDPPPPPLPV
ncbi:unnamed protein product [Cylindrotheca closterium]|uniref:Exostosin GT47 domain-containing protein n=1 Tax=Cylindrotheca closterium TaxID=2856 RepID=A0AAD2FL72_9STRA|nr:unnamed protein product [Cylindrotheca closterium]